MTASLDEGFALPPIEAFSSKINDKTKAILLCNPGNPTGTVYAPEALDALAELVRAHDLYLFADEVYREFCYDGAKPKSVMELPGLEDNVVLVDSVSKTLQHVRSADRCFGHEESGRPESGHEVCHGSPVSSDIGPGRLRGRPSNVGRLFRRSA